MKTDASKIGITTVGTTKLGKILQRARELKNYTPAAIALKMDISLAELKAVEKGDKHPTPDYFVDICKLLDVDLEKAWDLLEYEKLYIYRIRFIREYRQAFNIKEGIRKNRLEKLNLGENNVEVQ